jgi:SIR2-like domain
MIELPEELYEDLLAQRVVIFAGAGTTTESGSKLHPGPTFYESVKAKCKYPKTKPDPPFPDLMQYFCDHVDGGQRNRLVSSAIERIETFAAPGDENRFATMFAYELAKLPYVDRIVTTNWDPFLEQSMNILVPMVEDRDLAFWHDTKRQVLKIHGCITRPYTLVATRDDYETCVKRNPLVFNKLRDLMASRTFVFVGYSLRDSDFRLIWEDIIKSLGQLRRLAFVVDPEPKDEKTEFWKANSIRHIRMSDVAFVRSIYTRLVKDGHLPSEKFLSFFAKERQRALRAHFEREQSESNGAFASAMYQDGLLHSFSEVLTGASLGKRPEELERKLRGLEKHLEMIHKRGDKVEYAYWRGRAEVLGRFCERDTSRIPVYFHPSILMPSQKYIRG